MEADGTCGLSSNACKQHDDMTYRTDAQLFLLQKNESAHGWRMFQSLSLSFMHGQARVHADRHEIFLTVHYVTDFINMQRHNKEFSPEK